MPYPTEWQEIESSDLSEKQYIRYVIGAIITTYFGLFKKKCSICKYPLHYILKEIRLERKSFSDKIIVKTMLTTAITNSFCGGYTELHYCSNCGNESEVRYLSDY